MHVFYLILLLVEVKYNDEAVTLMHGKYWGINKSKTPDEFCNDFYTSMDHVNINEYDIGWNFLTNIEEPIFFIHDCVSFNQKIKRQLPQDCKPANAYSSARVTDCRNIVLHIQMLMLNYHVDQNIFAYNITKAHV